MSNDDFEIFGEAGVQYGNDVVPVNLGDTESFLRDVIDLISSAPNAPLSSAPKINREQVLGLLEEALDCLPPEIAEARWMLAERDQFRVSNILRRQHQHAMIEQRLPDGVDSRVGQLRHAAAIDPRADDRRIRHDFKFSEMLLPGIGTRCSHVWSPRATQPGTLRWRAIRLVTAYFTLILREKSCPA